LKSNLTHNKSLLDDSITCPKCKHDFSLTTETPLSEIKNQILKLDKDIEKIEKEIESINKVVKLKNEQLNSIKSQDFKIRTIKDSIKELQEQKQEIIDDIKQLKSELVELKNKDLLLKKQSVDLQLKPLKAKLDEQNQKLSESQELFELLEQEKRKYDFWEHHFSRKGFISYLANKVVKSIEGMTNLYLKKYNTNLALEINGFTKLKSGELREKIEVFVVKDGSNLGRFNRYSGGQKARINISSVLATHALINNSCESGGLNFLAIDEKFDEALDYRGRKATTQILDSTNITSILISHHSASELDCRNRIQIQFKDKVSKIV
jgi:exonuclease SbcC